MLNGEIIVGLKNSVKTIDIETAEQKVIYSDKDSKRNLDIVAAAPLDFDTQLVLTAAKLKPGATSHVDSASLVIWFERTSLIN